MKTTHKFKGSWYVSSMIAVIIVGELIAAAVANLSSLTLSPVVVAFACAGLVALAAMIFFKDAEIE